LSTEFRRDNWKSLKHIRKPNGANSVISQWFLILPCNDNLSTIRLQTRLKWRVHPPLGPVNLSPTLAKLLSIAFPQGRPDTADTWSPQDFYRSVHVPSKDLVVPAQIQSDLLGCQLYPFQKRAVRWMLHREGVDIGSGGSTSSYQCERDVDAPPLFYPGIDADGRHCLVSHLLGVISTQAMEVKSSATSISGGILAEEMGEHISKQRPDLPRLIILGLGKTVELISLICLFVKKWRLRMFRS
jgi:E3 ubiquitin-protein ligase SHPRH